MFRKILAAAATLGVAGALSLGAVAGPAFADGAGTPPTDSTAPATSTPTDAPTTPPSTDSGVPSTPTTPPTPTTPSTPAPTPSTPASVPPKGSVSKAAFLSVPLAKTCLPASAVSYTYDPATNSGVITVANPDPSTYTDVLCKGFWVTAAAWSYLTVDTFPQEFAAATPANGGEQITGVGTYKYGQAVACGQGDIYASYDALPDPQGTLVSTGDPYHEVFLYNLGFTGPDSTFTLSPQSCHLFDPVAPTVTVNSDCTAGSITWTDIPGKVTYALTSGNGHSGKNEVTVTAVAPWIFQYNMTSYVYHIDLGAAGTCPVVVGDPSATSAVCQDGVQQNGSITVDLKQGIVYEITGPNGFDVVPTTATTSVPPGDYVVTAKPLNSSYVLDPAHPSSWPYTVSVPSGDCLPTLADFTITWTSTNSTCSTGFGTITVGPAEFAGFVNFFVDGKPVVPGQPVRATAGQHLVTATPVDPADTVDNPQQLVTVTGTSVLCPEQLKTLALTGSADPTPWIVGGIALLQFGLALVIIGRVRKHLARPSAR